MATARKSAVKVEQPGRAKRGRPVDARKHAEILTVARRVFLEFGYREASMDMIARRAGVSKITVYAHFSSKAALFGAIIQDLAGRLTRKIERLALVGLKPEQALRQVGRAYLKLALAPGSLALHRLVVSEAARHPELGRLIHRSGPQPIVGTLADYLASRAELKLENPPLAAEQFLGTVLGHQQLRLLLTASPGAKARAAIDEVVDHAVRLFLDGCRR